MKRKKIPFSLEMVKKIQAGEIKGTMRTVGGDTVRFLGEIKNPEYPLLFARKIKHSSEEESLDTCTLTGRYNTKYEHENDIILEIEEEQQEQECQFKPFDKVLVRDVDNEEWKADFFSRYYTDYRYDYECVSGAYIQCIPYDGNEHLLGTTNKPKEE